MKIFVRGKKYAKNAVKVGDSKNCERKGCILGGRRLSIDVEDKLIMPYILYSKTLL